jgi:hypothetical protein
LPLVVEPGRGAVDSHGVDLARAGGEERLDIGAAESAIGAGDKGGTVSDLHDSTSERPLDFALKVWLSSSPGYGGGFEGAVEQVRLLGTQLELVVVETHDADLPLAPPVRKPAHEHLLLEDPLGLIDVIEAE